MNQDKIYKAYCSDKCISYFGEYSTYRTIDDREVNVIEICDQDKEPSSKWDDLFFVGLVKVKDRIRGSDDFKFRKYGSNTISSKLAGLKNSY